MEISLKELAPQVVHDVRLPVQALEAGLSGSFHILLQKSPAPKREVQSINTNKNNKER